MMMIMINRFGEQSVSKCVAITIETRPDYCLKPHLNNMLRYGCTRIEIGVQSVYEVGTKISKYQNMVFIV